MKEIQRNNKQRNNKIQTKLANKKVILNPKWLIMLHVCMILLGAIGGFFMLEYSSEPSLEHLVCMEMRYIVLNCLTLVILTVIIIAICNRVWLSCLLCTCFCGIIAVVNYYVIMYHGMPLSFLMIKNFATVMGVASSYHFSIDKVVSIMGVITIGLSILFLGIHFFIKDRVSCGRKRWMKSLMLVVTGFLIIRVCYFGGNPVKPKNTIKWLWSEAYYEYGYAACTVESISAFFNCINMPEGYSEDAVTKIDIEERNNDEFVTPDIILILNETFYDLKQIADFETDIPYLKNIENMENVLRGYAVSPASGGGTNDSEYELLTSNSLQIMPGITPFNILDLSKANSVVSLLKEQRYITTGSHTQAARVYSRGQAYTALGFQGRHFQEDFIEKEYYYNRIWYQTDESAYKNLIRWYTDSSQTVPQFQYLLTIQNHGDWEFNEPEQDIIHTKKDFGNYTERVNEYLTGIYLSDLAFKELTDYFSEQERPVIICMVGDHCPSFASEIADKAYTEDELALRLRKVPLIIWANFDLGDETDLGTMSMPYVVPTLLEMAGVSISPYYSYMLNIKDSVPIMTAYGVYYDKDGNIYRYDEDKGMLYEKLVDNYFYLEYNNLQPKRKQNLFTSYQK